MDHVTTSGDAGDIGSLRFGVKSKRAGKAFFGQRCGREDDAYEAQQKEPGEEAQAPGQEDIEGPGKWDTELTGEEDIRDPIEKGETPTGHDDHAHRCTVGGYAARAWGQIDDCRSEKHRDVDGYEDVDEEAPDFVKADGHSQPNEQCSDENTNPGYHEFYPTTRLSSWRLVRPATTFFKPSFRRLERPFSTPSVRR